VSCPSTSHNNSFLEQSVQIMIIKCGLTRNRVQVLQKIFINTWTRPLDRKSHCSQEHSGKEGLSHLTVSLAHTLLITHPPWPHPVKTNFPFHHDSSLVYISLWKFPYDYHVLTPWFVNSLLVTLPSAGTYIEMDMLHVLWSDTSAPHIACPAWWWRVYPEIETQYSPQKKVS
jgi:hypothetical protein